MLFPLILDASEEDYKSLPADLQDEEVIPRVFHIIEVLLRFIQYVKFLCSGPFTRQHSLEGVISSYVCLGGFSHCSNS